MSESLISFNIKRLDCTVFLATALQKRVFRECFFKISEATPSEVPLILSL